MNQTKKVFEGNIFAVTQEEKIIDGKTIIFENAVRAPGIRLIIPKEDKLLLSKEYRYELGSEDFRLAGGKVVNSLAEYLQISEDEDKLQQAAREAAKREAREELGIIVEQLELFSISKLGATVKWDLYYFLINGFSEIGKQELESGEKIQPVWLTSQEVKQMCVNGAISEERSAIALLRYFNSIQ